MGYPVALEIGSHLTFKRKKIGRFSLERVS